jgi:hypothetical protein
VRPFYTIAPLTFRERAAMKAELDREAGQPAFCEQLLATRPATLQELAPDNLAELLAVLDEAEAITDASTRRRRARWRHRCR